jgi:hypothetical protein
MSYPSKASGATPNGCARAHPPEKSNTKASRGPDDNQAKSLATSIPDVQPLEEYPYSPHSLRGYYRVPQLGVPKSRKKSPDLPI